MVASQPFLFHLRDRKLFFWRCRARKVSDPKDLVQQNEGAREEAENGVRN